MKRGFKLEMMHVVYLLLSLSIFARMLIKYTGFDLLRKVLTLINLILLACLVIYEIGAVSKKVVISTSNIIIALFVLYELGGSLVNGLLRISAIVDILVWPMLYISFKTFSSKHEFSYFYKCLTVINMISIFIMSIFLIKTHLKGAMFDDGGGVVFYVYYCITFMPLIIFAIKDKRIVNLFFCSSIILLAISTKRTGFLTATMGYILYLLTDINVRRDLKSKFVEYWKFIIGITVSLIFVLKMNERYSFLIIERLQNLFIDNGSGRIAIWKFVLDAYKQSDCLSKLFGHGYQAVYYRLKPFGVDRLAHSSYLEFLYDYGIVGLMLFCLFLLFMIVLTIRGYKEKNESVTGMMYTLVISAAVGCTSYFFEESAIIAPIAVFWGCYEGERVRAYKQIKDKKGVKCVK